jgi:hypothetical protein
VGNLLEIVSAANGVSYSIVVIDDQDRVWLRLTEKPLGKLLQFWSSKTENANRHDYHAIIDQIYYRLRLVEQGEMLLHDALRFWPADWDYWGGGMPQPISSFLQSKDFTAQLALL